MREDEDVPWTEGDENRFCDEIFNVQLEKVAQFQDKTFNNLKEQADTAFEKLKDMAPSEEKPKSDITTARLKELKGELDTITNEVKELKKYGSANYTGFLKIAKKHDRKRGDRYKVRPMMRVSLAERGFNSEQAYSPILTKLSLMYYAINQNLDEGEQNQPLNLDLDNQQEVHNGERYTAYKCKFSRSLQLCSKLIGYRQFGYTRITFSKLRRPSYDIYPLSSTHNKPGKSPMATRTPRSHRSTSTTPSSSYTVGR